MQLKIQVLTEQGNYGPALLTKCRTIAGISEAILTVLDATPDNIKDTSIMDWTKITIEVIRD